MAISVGELRVLLPGRPTLTWNLAAVLVGNAQSWVPELVERARKLKVNQGFEQGTDLYVTYPCLTSRLSLKLPSASQGTRDFSSGQGQDQRTYRFGRRRGRQGPPGWPKLRGTWLSRGQLGRSDGH